MFIPTTLKLTDLYAMPAADLAAIRQVCINDLQKLKPNNRADKPYYNESKQMLLTVDSLLGF